jgi:YlmC/YmxH family sporulation protein
MRISELQAKDVINICDGKKLGHVVDVDFDLQNGRIDALMIPHAVKFFGWLGGGTELVITWRQIVKIGADVILVRIEEGLLPHDDDVDVPYEMVRPMRKV